TFAGLDVLDPDVALFRPVHYRAADVFRTVVTANGFRLAAPFDDLFQRADHALRRQREVDFDAEPLAVVVVNDVEQSEAASVSQLVVHEVHRPGLVDGDGYRQ